MVIAIIIVSIKTESVLRLLNGGTSNLLKPTDSCLATLKLITLKSILVNQSVFYHRPNADRRHSDFQHQLLLKTCFIQNLKSLSEHFTVNAKFISTKFRSIVSIILFFPLQCPHKNIIAPIKTYITMESTNNPNEYSLRMPIDHQTSVMGVTLMATIPKITVHCFNNKNFNVNALRTHIRAHESPTPFRFLLK